MPTVIVIVVIVLIAAAVAAFLINKRDKAVKIAKADELRSQAATEAQSTIAPAQQSAAEAEAKAEEARLQAERAQAEAREAQVAAQQVEAEHESQVREADRLDPRVDDTSDEYAPQVPGSVDQQPTPPSEANREPESVPQTDPAPAAPTESTDQSYTDGTTTTETQDAGSPELPRRTRGAQEMPGSPIEQTDGGGGWFTRQDDPDRTDKA